MEVVVLQTQISVVRLRSSKDVKFIFVITNKLMIRYRFLVFLFSLYTLSASGQTTFNSIELVAESDKKTLTQIVDLDVNISDKNIQIFIADVYTSSVIIGEKKGNKIILDKRLGREGLGPGEFIEINNVQFTNNYGLIVYDRNLGRISLFDAQNQKLDQTIKLNTRRKTHFPMEVLIGQHQNTGTKHFYTRSERFFSD